MKKLWVAASLALIVLFSGIGCEGHKYRQITLKNREYPGNTVIVSYFLEQDHIAWKCSANGYLAFFPFNGYESGKLPIPATFYMTVDKRLNRTPLPDPLTGPYIAVFMKHISIDGAEHYTWTGGPLVLSSKEE